MDKELGFSTKMGQSVIMKFHEIFSYKFIFTKKGIIPMISFLQACIGPDSDILR